MKTKRINRQGRQALQERRVNALARKLWRLAYKTACKADPQNFWGFTTWDEPRELVGRKAGWNAVARYVLKHFRK